MVRQLMQLTGIGSNGSWLVVMEFFGWRAFTNRRHVGGIAGLTPTLSQSGESARDQGISKAGNGHVRWMTSQFGLGLAPLSPGQCLERVVSGTPPCAVALELPLRRGSAAAGGARSAAGAPTPRAHPAPARGEKVRLFGLSASVWTVPSSPTRRRHAVSCVGCPSMPQQTGGTTCMTLLSSLSNLIRTRTSGLRLRGAYCPRVLVQSTGQGAASGTNRFFSGVKPLTFQTVL